LDFDELADYDVKGKSSALNFWFKDTWFWIRRWVRQKAGNPE
jgi:hypothetical protein